MNKCGSISYNFIVFFFIFYLSYSLAESALIYVLAESVIFCPNQS